MPYVERVTKAGNTIEIERYFTSRYKKKGISRGDKVKPTKEEQEKVNTRQAERKLRILINANYGYGDYHLVLDYIRRKGEPDRTPEQMRQDIDVFLRECRKEYRKAGLEFKYIHVMEIGKKGARHHHLVVNKIDTEILQRCWYKAYEGHNRVKVFPLDDSGNYAELASYLIKYTGTHKRGKIVNEDYSPAAVLGELKAQGKEGDFSVTVCVTTLYSYIDKGIFLKLSNKNLPVKKNKKRNYKKVQRQQKRAAAGESIDKRPKEIDTREEFGNWEMDSVLGKRGKSKNTLLVLTERKTRNEIIFKLPDHTDEAVVAALDRLERKWGADMFKRVFKTITVDNGSEFADAEGLQRSIINEGEKRTKVYYCHPYSSWERGTNEVTNKMIRRKIPKGTNFDDRTEEEVESIENWINGYPRKIHGYHSAGELFEEEVKQLA